MNKLPYWQQLIIDDSFTTETPVDRKDELDRVCKVISNSFSDNKEICFSLDFRPSYKDVINRALLVMNVFRSDSKDINQIAYRDHETGQWWGRRLATRWAAWGISSHCSVEVINEIHRTIGNPPQDEDLFFMHDHPFTIGLLDAVKLYML